MGGEGDMGFRDGWKGVRVVGAKVDDVPSCRWVEVIVGSEYSVSGDTRKKTKGIVHYNSISNTLKCTNHLSVLYILS